MPGHILAIGYDEELIPLEDLYAGSPELGFGEPPAHGAW